MKEVMEPTYHFLPTHHVDCVWELLELPSTPTCTHLADPLIPYPPPPIMEETFTVSPFLRPQACTLRDAIIAPTLVPDSPLHAAMGLDAPAPLYAPMPATPVGVTVIHHPPTPPVETHDSWCACSPCLAAQDELYGT